MGVSVFEYFTLGIYGTRPSRNKVSSARMKMRPLFKINLVPLPTLFLAYELITPCYLSDSGAAISVTEPVLAQPAPWEESAERVSSLVHVT